MNDGCGVARTRRIALSNAQGAKRGRKSKMKPVESEEAAQARVCKTVDLIPAEGNTLTGSEDGDNSLSQGIRNEPEQNTQLGTGENQDSLFDDEDDPPLNIEAVEERFIDRTKNRLKQTVQREYLWKFRQLATYIGMSKLTRRQISSNKGKELLLKFLENEKPRTRRFSNAMLKSVWSYGLNLPYPIDSRRDLGKLPKVGRRCSPPDALIEQWARAVEKEEDLYLKLLVMSVMLHGWRPSHVCKLKQRNVRLDAGGMPVAIIANGYDEGFKTNAPIIAHLCENYSNSLMEFRKCLNSTLPERPLLPFRSTTGVVSLDREMTVDGFSRQWGRFRKKHCLPKLRPVDLRHWTASVYRRAGLSKVASAAFLGHYPSYGGSMRDWYDSPQDEDILREQQERLPDGTLGFLFPKIEITQGIPEEMLGVLGDYIAGKIGTMDMASQMETFRLRLLEKPISNAQL